MCYGIAFLSFLVNALSVLICGFHEYRAWSVRLASSFWRRKIGNFCRLNRRGQKQKLAHNLLRIRNWKNMPLKMSRVQKQ
jgi:hypothetical protein